MTLVWQIFQDFIHSNIFNLSRNHACFLFYFYLQKPFAIPFEVHTGPGLQWGHWNRLPAYMPLQCICGPKKRRPSHCISQILKHNICRSMYNDINNTSKIIPIKYCSTSGLEYALEKCIHFQVRTKMFIPYCLFPTINKELKILIATICSYTDNISSFKTTHHWTSRQLWHGILLTQ
jgi:hypothetical protein